VTSSADAQLAERVAAFRGAMKCRADTVHLLTYRTAEGVAGMTATAVCALSMAPPSVLVCVNRTARAYASISTHGTIGVSILSVEQLQLATEAGGSGGNKTLGPELTVEGDSTLTPVLAGALASLQGRVVESLDLFTHTVYVVEVLQATVRQPGQPLLHHQGAYATVAASPPR
jgi:flavin reductase (DIM6/NTAB) family NADH-FMN oxidoreductase RutF